MNDGIQNPIKNLSIYRFENFFNVYNDVETKTTFYNILKNITVYPANDNTIDHEYQIKEGDNWPYISYKFYNTTDLWWLVCEYNQISNPIEIPENGKMLKILKSDYVHIVLNELKKQLNR